MQPLDPRGLIGIDIVHVMIVGGVETDMRTGCEQQPQFCAHEFAAADQQHGTGAQIEEYRQEAHAILRCPAMRG